MFRSKLRDLVIPQSEHLKLVGTLALLWGNENFDAPPIHRNSMIMGMGLHDRGYGYLDNSPIGGMSDEEWQVIARRGFHMECSDAVADTIVKYHIRRLASQGKTELRKVLFTEFSLGVEEHLKRHSLSQIQFDRLDRITDLLDRISFEFCFEAPAFGAVSVFPHNSGNDEVPLQFRVEDGQIRVTPWPFSVNEHRGYLVAYQRNRYPDRLDPMILPYQLRNG